MVRDHKQPRFTMTRTEVKRASCTGTCAARPRGSFICLSILLSLASLV